MGIQGLGLETTPSTSRPWSPCARGAAVCSWGVSGHDATSRLSHLQGEAALPQTRALTAVLPDLRQPRAPVLLQGQPPCLGAASFSASLCSCGLASLGRLTGQSPP